MAGQTRRRRQAPRVPVWVWYPAWVIGFVLLGMLIGEWARSVL